MIPWLRIWLGDSQLQRCCYGATWDVVSSRNGPCHVDKTKEDGWAIIYFTKSMDDMHYSSQGIQQLFTTAYFLIYTSWTTTLSIMDQLSKWYHARQCLDATIRIQVSFISKHQVNVSVSSCTSRSIYHDESTMPQSTCSRSWMMPLVWWAKFYNMDAIASMIWW